MDPKEYTIEVENLCKRYGKLEAVAGISFRVRLSRQIPDSHLRGFRDTLGLPPR